MSSEAKVICIGSTAHERNGVDIIINACVKPSQIKLNFPNNTTEFLQQFAVANLYPFLGHKRSRFSYGVTIISY